MRTCCRRPATPCLVGDVDHHGDNPALRRGLVGVSHHTTLVSSHRLAHGVEIREIHRVELEPPPLQDLRQDPVGAPVHVVTEDHVVAGLEDGEQHRLGGHARREAQAVGALSRAARHVSSAVRVGFPVRRSRTPCSGRLFGGVRRRLVDRDVHRAVHAGSGPARRGSPSSRTSSPLLLDESEPAQRASSPRAASPARASRTSRPRSRPSWPCRSRRRTAAPHPHSHSRTGPAVDPTPSGAGHRQYCAARSGTGSTMTPSRPSPTNPASSPSFPGQGGADRVEDVDRASSGMPSIPASTRTERRRATRHRRPGDRHPASATYDA